MKAEVAIARERERKQLVRQAETLEVNERWTLALRAWGKVLDQGVDAPQAETHYRLCQGKVYEQAEKAISDGEEEIAIQLFRILEERGSYRDAGSRRKVLEQHRAQDLAEAAEAKYREGFNAYALGHLEEARRLFEEALRLDPKGKRVRQALDQVTEELKLSPAPKP